MLLFINNLERGDNLHISFDALNTNRNKIHYDYCKIQDRYSYEYITCTCTYKCVGGLLYVARSVCAVRLRCAA